MGDDWLNGEVCAGFGAVVGALGVVLGLLGCCIKPGDFIVVDVGPLASY